MNIPQGPWYIDDLLTFTVVTTVFATGVATDADAAPAYRVYEDETGTPILTGTMALLDSANTAGLYSEQITLSAANGFEVGKTYSIYAAATVSSVAGATSGGFKVIATPVAQTGDSFARLGTPAGASVSADIAAVKSDTAAILLDTGTDGVVVAAASKTGYRLSATGVDDIFDEATDGTTTLREGTRLWNSATGGIASGLETTNAKYRDLADSKDRIDATVDADGNRTAVTLDLT